MTAVNQVGNALTGSTGTGLFVGATSPTLVTPVLGASSATSITFSSTSGIIGTTTNNSAAAGSVGEFVTASVSGGSPTALTTSTRTDLITISLTAGDWDVWATIGLTGAASTTFSVSTAAISTVSATLSDGNLTSQIAYFGSPTIFTVNDISACVPQQRISLSTTTTIYLVVDAVFGVSTCSGYGTLNARRIR